jgi:hypothetical protein
VYRSAILLIAAIAFAGVRAASAESDINFGWDIQPILSERCYQCHGPDAAHRMANLRLDDEESAKKKVIVPGEPDKSLLLKRILTDDPLDVMPPPDSNRERLSAEEADLIRRWIEQGAEWGEHWAFVKPERLEPPGVDSGWPQTPIDQFILAELQEAGLEPSPPAAREALLRRVHFDLTGLPPTLEELEAFLADDAPDAFEKVVDQLLASPAYGERMAIDWLDGARYADTNGFQNDFSREMWLWRDWVIDAFNANMPYDQFAIEQLAGDLLPDATQSQRIASGFNRNNRANTEGGSIEEEWYVENRVDRVETTSSVFLGLSMGCARCHDHKYDPVSQREFFEFYAFFNSTEDRGFYEETRGNTGPVEVVNSFENQVRIAQYDASIAKAESLLTAAQADTEANFTAWLAKFPGLSEPVLGRTLELHLPLDGSLEGFEDLAITTRDDGAMWTEGLLGQSLLLDGNPDSALAINDGPVAFEHDQAFTVAAWVKPDGEGALFSKMDDAPGHRGVDILIGKEGEVSVHLIHEAPDNALTAVSTPRVALGGWSHIAVSYDGSGKFEGLGLYINGEQAELNIGKDALDGSIHSGAPLRIGRRSDGLALKGAVADFRVFNRAIAERRLLELVDYTVSASLEGDLSDERRAMHRDLFDRRGDAVVRERQAALDGLKQEKAEYIRDEVPTVMIMRELPEPRPTYLLERGLYDHADKSEELWPATPAVLHPMPEDAPRNRLGLAKWLVHPDNPLTPRVTVNREWERLFGRGLVDTPEDFGVQAAPPSHPALLDWLAVEFVESGWDLKALQKRIVMSAAYQQDSRVTDDHLEHDPENRLYARGPRHRLPAELIRDNALAVSGLLVDTIGGPSVMPYQPEGLWDDLAGGAGQGPYVLAEGEDLYRRSLYTYRKRTVSHPTLATFDAPTWELCWIRRTQTNTPMQALALLNDTTYVEAARHLAQRMLTEAADGRLAHGFRLATGRVPSEREVAMLADGLNNYIETFRAHPEKGEAFIAHGASPVPDDLDPVELAAYTAVAAVILNLDETITKE